MPPCRPSCTSSDLRRAGIGAFFRPRTSCRSGVSYHQLQRLVAEGACEKVGPGLYRLADVEPTEMETIAMVASAVPPRHRLPALRPARPRDRHPVAAPGLARDRPQGPQAEAAPGRGAHRPVLRAMLTYGVDHAVDARRAASGSRLRPARSSTASATGTRSASTSRWRRCATRCARATRQRQRDRPRAPRSAASATVIAAVPGGAVGMSRARTDLAAAVDRAPAQPRRARRARTSRPCSRAYAERFLYRLGASSTASRFVLKGAIAAAPRESNRPRTAPRRCRFLPTRSALRDGSLEVDPRSNIRAGLVSTPSPARRGQLSDGDAKVRARGVRRRARSTHGTRAIGRIGLAASLAIDSLTQCARRRRPRRVERPTAGAELAGLREGRRT